MKEREWLKISRLQWYSFMAIMPLMAVILNHIMFRQAIFQDFRIWLFSIPLMCILGFVSWRISLVAGNWLKHELRDLRQTKIRIIYQALLILPFISICILLLFWMYDALNFLGYEWTWESVRIGWLVGLGLIFLVETLYEADYALFRYKESIEERNRLEQIAVYQEFDTLKNLVNPHFLFNCFNTLSSLISEDRVKAGQFLNELSKVYRYLLRNNRETLSTVESEINFIRSYYQLLKTRYGEALELNIDVNPGYGKYMLPSLSLQLLVENAVKHNIVSSERPLVIDIFTTEGNRLIVNNNLQRKLNNVMSNRVGLNNIRSKYQLLHQQGFQLIEDGKNFTVVLPLIWNKQLTSKDTLVSDFKK